MKKHLIVFLICLAISAAMCLTVSRPAGSPPLLPILGNTTATHSQPSILPTGSDSTSTGPLPIAPIRLYICQREDAASYEALADQYFRQTGTPCQVVTGDLEDWMESDTPPTIFCLHSQADAARWQGALYDLSGSDALAQLYHPNFALTLDGKPVALAMDVTAYGIVYNAALLAQVGYTREDILDLSDFCQKVEAVTAEKIRLGFSAFTAPDMTNTRLAALLANGIQDPAALRTLLDLMRANQSKGNALSQFNTGKTVFYIAGAWEYAEFSQQGFHNLDFLPFFTGTDSRFPCISSFYWAIHSQAGEDLIAMALDFLYWTVTAGDDGAVPVDSLGIFAPFRSATGGPDVFHRLLLRKHLANANVILSWSLTAGMNPSALDTLTKAMNTYLSNPIDENWLLIEQILPST